MTYRYIYKITCTSGTFKNKFYFGQHTTKNLDDGYKGSGKKILNYYKKYPNDYIKEIICFCDSQEELNQREHEIIHPLLDDPMCLNIAEGGFGGNICIYTDEHKQKISDTLKEYYKVHQHKLKGRKLSAEHIKKLSESHKGKHIVQPKRETSWNKGIPTDEETKIKISASLKGRESPMKGKKWTDEQKAKLKNRIPWNKGIKISTL